MSTTTFKVIDHEVNKAIENRGSDVPAALIEEHCMTYVGGFPIVNPAKLEELSRSRASSQNNYIANRKQLKTDLEARGVKAKAFLPLRVWKQVCEKSGLFRMSPSGDNKVLVRVNAEQINGLWIMATVVVLAVTALSVIGYHAPHYYHIGIGELLLYLAITCIVSAVAIAIAGGIWFGGLEDFSAPVNLWLHSKLISHRHQLLHLMPEMHSNPDTFNSGDKRTSYRLILPTPPASVTETLSKLVGFGHTLHVAAVPEAIKFNASFFEIYRLDHQDRAIRRREEAALRRDPIVYVQYGDAVAIVEQFGDFPIELETVRKVLNLEYLI